MKGITDGNRSIVVMDMSPARKRPSLCVIEGNTITRYASFTSEAAGDEFINILSTMIGAQVNEES